MSPSRAQFVYPLVLSVGYDIPLLLTRNQALRRSGYTVVPAINRYQAAVAAANHPVTVAILCYTIPQPEATRLAHDLDIVRPGIAILRLQDAPGREHEAAIGSELMLQVVRSAMRGSAR